MELSFGIDTRGEPPHPLDETDPLRRFRSRFHIPVDERGRAVAYLTGNSLGLMPKATREAVTDELEDWATLGVDGHFRGRRPWYDYHKPPAGPMARIVGAQPDEVVIMNGLTANLHLLMVSLFRPERAGRRKILIEFPTFPSDLYAVQTQLAHHGLDPDADLIRVEPAPGEDVQTTEQFESAIYDAGDNLALVLLSGVNYLTGQAVDIERITAAAHSVGALAGFDLAHAAGNVPLHLHDWGADFAVWCTYKYLNAGPGAVAGAFVHQRHAADTSLPRFGGWWGNDPETRFRMHLEPEFKPVASADGWQLSNPPILAMAPLHASLALFEEAGGMTALREKSLKLTNYLLDKLAGIDGVTVITPTDPARRGCQVSLRLDDRARERRDTLQARGVICDFREPNIVRAAPVPLYNSFADVDRLVAALRDG
jgi:kynureninase